MSRSKLIARFQRYWKQEFASVFLLPVTSALWMILSSQEFGWFSCACFFPAAALLVLGASYWRGKAMALMGEKDVLDRVLANARTLRVPILIGVVTSLFLCAVDLFIARISVSNGDRIVGYLAAIMGVLEYTNYFCIQLQHFDHRPDFRRLVAGQGFHRSHLWNDLRRTTDDGAFAEEQPKNLSSN